MDTYTPKERAQTVNLVFNRSLGSLPRVSTKLGIVQGVGGDGLAIPNPLPPKSSNLYISTKN